MIILTIKIIIGKIKLNIFFTANSMQMIELRNLIEEANKKTNSQLIELDKKQVSKYI